MDINRICLGCMRELPQGQSLETCCYCGYQNSRAEEKQPYHHLRTSSILAGKYLVGKVLGEGGFGITYIGFDLNIECKVAIKEFYPNGYVTRDGASTSRVTDYEGPNLQMVQKWKSNFIKEAQALASCVELPGVVGAKEFFRENNTAYIIMEYLEGETLKEYLQRKGGKIPAEEVLALMKPVITSLKQMHAQGLIHRDISPDNLMVLSRDNIKLLDFGAAREYAVGDEKSLSVMLKPGYAPEEQYRTKGKQGPWSDVYALCATIYKCITGVTPPEAMERMREDDLVPPAQLGIVIPKDLEEALLKGMEVYAERRIRNMQELYNCFYPENQKQDVTEESAETEEQNIEIPKKQEEVSEQHTESAGKKNRVLATVAILSCLLIGLLVWGAGFQREQKKQEQDQDQNQKSNEKPTLSPEDAEVAYAFYGDMIVHMVEENNLPHIEGNIFEQEMFQKGDFPDIYAAIQDVDHDGIKELILRLENSKGIDSRKRQIIYQYDTDKRDVLLEMDVRAVGDFYSDGIFIAKEMASAEEKVFIMLYNVATGKYEEEETLTSLDNDIIRQYVKDADVINIDYSKVTVH